MKKIVIIGVGLVIIGCSPDNEITKDLAATSGPNYQETLQEQLLNAKSGDVIEIPVGTFYLNRSLSLSVDNVTIRGSGMEKSVLSFKNQVSGAEGILVTANNFTIENLAIEDTIGDGIKVSDSNNIIIRSVRVEWSKGASSKNGAYGFYPVQTTNVLLEDNVAIGASDAGLYVGQSKNVIVRRNRVEYNVAGIEIENTIDADVYNNYVTNNTGGILVFNMPGLQQEGKNTRIFDNKVFKNNTRNFGHKGTPVASVPAGTGIIINSNDYVEIFDNEISNNNTANIIISSVFSTNYSDADAVSNYDPYPEFIYIYDNKFIGGGNSPDGLQLKALKTSMFGITGSFPDVLWDGYYNAGKSTNINQSEQISVKQICLNNGDSVALNADSPGKNKNPTVGGDSYKCDLPKLPPVALSVQR